MISTKIIPINDPLLFFHYDILYYECDNGTQYEHNPITQAFKHSKIIQHNTIAFFVKTEELCPLNVISWCWGSAKISVVAVVFFAL